MGDGSAKGAKSRTARNPERREIPNGAKSRRARNPEEREIPDGGNADGRQPQCVILRKRERSEARPRDRYPAKAVRAVTRSRRSGLEPRRTDSTLVLPQRVHIGPKENCLAWTAILRSRVAPLALPSG